MKTFSKKLLFAFIALAVLIVSSIGVLAIEGDYQLSDATVGTSFSFDYSNNTIFLVKENYDSGDLNTRYVDYRTAGLVSDDGSESFYYNEFNSYYDVTKEIKWFFASSGPGHNNISDGHIGIKNHVFVFSDKSLSSDQIVVSSEKENLVVTKEAYEGGFSIAIPANTLEADKDYYLFFSGDTYIKDEESSLGTPIIFKFETTGAHDHVAQVTKEAKSATCTEDGWTEETRCSICNQVLSESTIIKAPGHSWDEGIITTEPNCTENGVKTKTCTVCNATMDEPIPALGHSFVGDTCERCGAEVEEVKSWEIGSPNSSDVIATLYNNGRFVLSGNGATIDYTSSSKRPYYNYRSSITSCEIESGISTLGKNLFNGTSLSEVRLPDTITSLNNNAFLGCKSLKDVFINTDASIFTIQSNSFTPETTATFHVKCNQKDEFTEKFKNFSNAEVVADIHNFENGICTRCAAVDPDYVAPEEPVVDPVATDDYNQFQKASNAASDIYLWMYMTTPDPAGIKTAGEQEYADGTKYWFNEITSPLDANLDQVFAMEISGNGANNSTAAGVANHYKIYDSNSFSDDHLVASVATGEMTNLTISTKRMTPDSLGGQPGNGRTISVTVPAGTLQNGNTYYFVADKGVKTNKDDRTTNTDYVFKFTTAETPEPDLTLTSSKDTLTLNSYTTLAVNGGQEGYTYHFDVKNNDTGNEWAPWEGFQDKSSFNWYAGPTSGNKTITATVKDADGNQVGEPLTLTVDVAPSDLLLSTISCSDPNPLATDTVNLNAAATGGSGNYEYRFRVQNNNTGKWWTIQNWDANNKAKWYAGPAGGSKTIYFDVKDTETGDTVTKKMIVGVQDTELKVDSITIDPENLTATTTTKLTANVANASEDLEYRFYVYNNGTGKLWQIQGYKKGGNTCNWYAGPAGGSKTIYVDVKDGNTITSLALDVTVAE